MKRRVISILLTLALTASMVGCGSGGKEENKESNAGGTEGTEEGKDELAEAIAAVGDDYNISMLYSDNATYPYQDDWLVWDIFKDNTGATLDVQAVPETDFDTKRQMIIQSGDVPDIITKTTSSSAGITNVEEVLLPISDYLDYMPNFKAFIDKVNLMPELDKMRESDGKFYILPVKVGDAKTQYHQWMVRTDLIEKAGLEIPKTLDDIYEVSKVLKEQNPKMIPIMNRFGSGNLMSGISAGYNTTAGWTIGNGMHYVEEDNNWVFSPTTPEFKDMLEYTHKLYADGLLDTEWTTMDSTVYEQKVVQGDTAIMYAWVGNQRIWNKQGGEIDPDYNVEVILPPTGPSGEYALEWVAAWEQSWVLPKGLADDTEHLAEVLHFVDWCYTDEAALALTLGVEGETCKKTEDGGYVYKDTTINYTSSEGLWNNCLNVRTYNAVPQTEEEIIDFESLNAIAELDAVESPDPASPLTPEQKEENSVMTTTLVTFINAQMESFIKGDLSLEDDWDKFVEECESQGSTELTKQYNDAWSARK